MTEQMAQPKTLEVQDQLSLHKIFSRVQIMKLQIDLLNRDMQKANEMHTQALKDLQVEQVKISEKYAINLDDYTIDDNGTFQLIPPELRQQLMAQRMASAIKGGLP